MKKVESQTYESTKAEKVEEVEGQTNKENEKG